MYVTDAKRLTAAGARRIVDTAVEQARRENIAITIAVVDAGGHLMLLERMDGGKFHSVHSATTKAVCAASNKRPTGSTAGPERWTAMEGGCPIMAGGECIGGVGVAGGNFEFDERIAREAVAAVAK